MPDGPSSDAKKAMEQTEKNLSKAMGQLSVTSDKTSPSLSDMPIDVVGLIIERSEYKQQLKLRKVCKSLRTLVDKSKPSCKNLRVICKAESVTLCFDEKKVFYAPSISKLHDFWTEYKKDRSISRIVDKNYEGIAFNDLAITLGNRKLQLEMLFFEFDENGHPCDIQWKYCRLYGVFESLWHKISTKAVRIQISKPSEPRPILPFLKPGVLEKIIIENSDGHKEYCVFFDIQWKQAKELELMDGSINFPLDRATHFKRFRFFEEKINRALLIRIRKFISCEVDNFEFCLLVSDSRFNAFKLFSTVGKQAAPNERTKYVSHYSIPDSDDYLEFMFLKKSVEIRRIQRS